MLVLRLRRCRLLPIQPHLKIPCKCSKDIYMQTLKHYTDLIFIRKTNPVRKAFLDLYCSAVPSAFWI